MGSQKILNISIACLMIMAALFSPRQAGAKPRATWTTSLRKRLTLLEADYPGRVGLYIKDLESGEEFTHRAEEPWYVASGVKLPVALELLRQVEAGKISLDERITLRNEDYVDGAGETNYKQVKSHLSVRFLFEQMLIHSDNTASDLLIRRIGLARVNQLVHSLVPSGFNRITTLADVRRHLYGELHPAAFRLRSTQLLLLHSTPDGEKLATLASLLNLAPQQLRKPDLETAYRTYYAKNLNSARLSAYGRLLELLSKGKVLRSDHTKLLLDTMARAETGKGRISAGLPGDYVFAHKTGTQHGRVCDFGILWRRSDQAGKRLVVTACTREIPLRQDSEMALKQIGQAIADSGVLKSCIAQTSCD